MINFRSPRSKNAVKSLNYGLGRNRKFKGDFDTKKNQDLLNARDKELIEMNARAIAVSANNLDPYNPEKGVKQNQKRWNQTEQVNQMSQIIISASDQDMQDISIYLKSNHRPYALIDCYQELADMGVEVAKKVYGKEYNIESTAHADGSHGKHTHVYTDLVNPETGIKANYDYDTLERIYDAVDEVAKSRGLELQKGLEKVAVLDEDGKPVTKKDKQGNDVLDKDGKPIIKTHIQRKGGYDDNRITYVEKQMIEKGKYSPIMDMKIQIDRARLEAENVSDLVKNLDERGIVAEHLDDNYKNAKFHWKEIKDGKHKGEVGMTVTSHRLGEGYSKESILKDISNPTWYRQETKMRLQQNLNLIEQRVNPRLKEQSQTEQLGMPAELRQTRKRETSVEFGEEFTSFKLTPKRVSKKKRNSDYAKDHEQWLKQHKEIEAQKAHHEAQKQTSRLDEEKHGTSAKQKALEQFRRVNGLERN